MAVITVLQRTVFKKSPADSSTLPATEKVDVAAGESFQVQTLRQEGNHYFVRLTQAINPVGISGYFYAPHIETNWQEIRGVWLTNVVSEVLFSPANVRNALDLLKELGFNTIYPTVWQNGYTLYRSQVTTPISNLSLLDPDPRVRFSDPGQSEKRDLLDEIIKEGHDRGFRVIPWFEFGLMAPLTSPLGQEAQKHQLLTLDNRQNPIRLVSHDENKPHKPDHYVWLNPCLQTVQDFMVQLISDVAERYEVDGIQLDDHFGFPVELGYDPATQQLYQMEMGRAAPRNHTDPDWVTWASRKVTNLLEKVVKSVKAKRPSCLISISPNPQGFSKKYYLADWSTWEQKGLAEEIILQVYGRKSNVFTEELQKPEVTTARDHIPFAVGILAGQQDAPIPFDSIQQEVEEVRRQGHAGISFFFYESLFNIRPSSESIPQRQSGFKSLNSHTRRTS